MLVLSGWVSTMDSVEQTARVLEWVGQQFTETVEGCDLAEISALADRSLIGKRLLNAFYVSVTNFSPSARASRSFPYHLREFCLGFFFQGCFQRDFDRCNHRTSQGLF